MMILPVVLILLTFACSAAERQEVRDYLKLKLEEKRAVVHQCFADPQCRQVVIDEVDKALKK